MTHDEMQTAIGQAVAVLGNHDDVRKYAHVGSSMYMPAEQCEDVDFAVLLRSGDSAAWFCTQMKTDEGWTDCAADYASLDSRWGSIRKGNVNLIVTHDRDFYDAYLLSMEVCKVLRLQTKNERIAVCRVVRDRQPGDLVRSELLEKEDLFG